MTERPNRTEHEPEMFRMVKKRELLALAEHWYEQDDPRAEIARGIENPISVKELLRLLTESDQHEAACAFAERALVRERDCGRDPDPRSWEAIEAKRAWLRGELTDHELLTARKAAWAATEAVKHFRPCAVWAAAEAAVWAAGQKASAATASWAEGLEAEDKWIDDWIMERAWDGERPLT